MSRSDDLSRPSSGRNVSIHYDPDAFGKFSEAIARNLGTARFLVIQTVVVTLWIIVNIFAVGLRWDPYPFILLNLAFSTQAAYAAPLILLAQNRQDDRDRAQTAEDRAVAPAPRPTPTSSPGRSPACASRSPTWRPPTMCATCWTRSASSSAPPPSERPTRSRAPSFEL